MGQSNILVISLRLFTFVSQFGLFWTCDLGKLLPKTTLKPKKSYKILVSKFSISLGIFRDPPFSDSMCLELI